MKPLTECLEQPELDRHLREIAIAAQKHPKGSLARQRTLTELVSALLSSNRLCRPYRGQFIGLYEDIYAEALQRLFSFVCDRIDDYSLEKGEVLQWTNFLLSRRFFIEASRDFMPASFKGINAKNIKRLSLEHLDRSNPVELNPQLTPSLSQEVKACIEEDPEGLFEQAHVTDHPDASFQLIACRRLEGYSWADLSVEFSVPVPTLSSFYRRCLVRFGARLKAYLS